MESNSSKPLSEYCRSNGPVGGGIEIKKDLKVFNLTLEDHDVADEDNYDTSVDEDELLKEYNYVCKINGVTDTGESVTVNVENYTPFFYVQVPAAWSKIKVSEFLNFIMESRSFVTKIGGVFVFCGKYLIKDQCVVSERINFMGYNKNGFKALRLVFKTRFAMVRCSNMINNHNLATEPKKVMSKYAGIKFNVFENNLTPFMRIVHIRDINFSSWINITSFTKTQDLERVSKAQLEITTDWNNLEKCLDPAYESKVPHLLQASYDIETYSHDNMFPKASDKQNCIFQIANTFKYYDEPGFFLRVILCLKKTSCIDFKDNVPTFMQCFDTEYDLLHAWSKLISNTDPDILYSYNGSGFDDPYLAKRAELCRVNNFFSNMSRDKSKPTVLKDYNFSSSAYGSTSTKRFVIPGRFNFDILTNIRREFKETSYKLDYIAEKYLGQNKNPVTPNQMFRAFRESDPDKLKVVADYCIVDTELPQRLVDTLAITAKVLALSVITKVPVVFITEKGESIKTFSQLLNKTRHTKFLVPGNFFSPDSVEKEKFTGAIVKEPSIGAYIEPVTVSDFASLYPSIIMAHNLCYSTILLQDSGDDGNVSTFSWDDKDINGDPVVHTYRYVQDRRGVIPELLEELALSRKKYKALMNSATDKASRDMYNRYQTSVKLSMNSIYGFLAAPMLMCKPIAATVTSEGRKMIEQTSDFIKSNYDASTVVYGDSVVGDTPILIKYRGRVTYLPIEELNDDIWKSYDNFKPHDLERTHKQQSTGLEDFQVWTTFGWSNIRKVIRHRARKDVYSIESRLGYVKVTGDHSLLDSEQKIIKPLELTTNSVLLSSIPISRINVSGILDEQCAYHYGALDSKGKGFTYIDKIMNADINVMGQYIKGFFKDIKMEEYTIFGKLNAAKLFYILNHVKITVELKCVSENSFMIFQNFTSPERYNNRVLSVKRDIFFDSANEYVYDIETDNGQFLAGVGSTVVKNTDSVFVTYNTPSSKKYKELYAKIKDLELDEQQAYHAELNNLKIESIRESIAVGKIASKQASRLFKAPIKLEYEKVYFPLILLTKKRYTGNLYSEDPEKPVKRDNKGIVLTRRDNFPLMKEMYSKILDIITEHGASGITMCIDYLNKRLSSMIHGKINIEDFIISKTYKTGYKSQSIAHVYLAKKLTERDPGTAPKPNDRVPYVYVFSTDKKVKMFTTAEDPDYVIENSLKLNMKYYIEFISKPIMEILKFFIADAGKSIFKQAIDEFNETVW